MKKNLLYIGLAILSIMSCTEIIDIDLDDQIETRLVVDASIISRLADPENGYQEIFLSHSRSYFDDVDNDNSVKDAIVKVKNNQTGVEVVFEESINERGKYTTNDLKAKVGTGYTILIEATLDGELQKFEGRDSIETSAPTVDSILLEKRLGFDGPIYETRINYLNPPTVDYFKFDVYFNDSLIINNHGNPNFFFSLIEDKFLGDTVTAFRVVDKVIDPKEETPPFNLRVTMKRISLQSYSFWRKLYANSTSGNDTPQTEVRGNINNITYPKRYALGTFMTSSESEKTVEITEYPSE